jgi:opine dehydrogenase
MTERSPSPSSERPVVVLGGGNTAFAIAAKLALEGRRVVLWEDESEAATIAPIRERRQVRLAGTGGEGTATLALVTTDPAEALAAGDVLLASVPSYAHAPFAERLLPHLRPNHLLALLPGNLGSLFFARRLRERGLTPGADGPTIAESDTAPYVCRKTAPDTATIWGVVPAMGIGVYPASQTRRALGLLSPCFPGAQSYPHALAAGLGAMNPIVHPPGVLMNAGRIEYARGEFYFYEEGVTPGVVRVIEALDAERRALAGAFGLSLLPVAEAFHAAGFGPKGDLWAAINGSRMLTQLRAPGSLQTRWLSEDVPYGLRTWAELGEQAGVPMPVARALVTLGDQVMGVDSWRTGRSLADLGIAGLSRADLETYLA